MAKPRGSRGSWFASWKGESLPCVHDYWAKGIWPKYCDPNVSDDWRWQPFIEAIRNGRRVILTNDKPDANGQPSGDRDSYIALYEVDKVEVIGSELHFDFVKRLEEFR